MENQLLQNRISQRISNSILAKKTSTSSACKSLGVMLGKHFIIKNYIKQICRTTHFNLCNIGAIRTLLSDNVAAQLVESLIISKLDYCTSLLYGLTYTSFVHLQSVQSSAARIVTHSQTLVHTVTPVLRSLHWLLIKPHVILKIF